ncbi:MaoC/PaaZ C-terminal domain-containing protein [Enterovirga sp.]|uniref:MaoC/PaaZ C-terminal domain-containing protein n=1 Tax=Enterovirga sp. TaxID=2026350 RepID=UPI002612799E|nr:MaoC/PaaZ C-terminal domain-containing protein [Enterovirga sp.]MDB5591404.1 MaoC domain protein dehydratase [Enterovirga sp.]
MPDIFFEDLQIGAVRSFGAVPVRRGDMVAFAREFDPQPFHLDEAAAAAAPPGRLIASGWYSCAILMRLFCDAWLLRAASLGGPGVEEVRWLRPVAAGDVLSLRQRILDTRVSRSRPEMGLATLESELLDAAGTPVLRMRHIGMFGRHDGGGAPPSPVPATAGAARAAPERLDRLPEPEDPALAPRWLDDIEIGRRVDLGTYHFGRERCIDFARDYDPQLFHLEDEAAAAGPFGRLAASGWHTGAAWMNRFVARLDRIAAAGGRPRTSVSPGLRDLQWLKPVFAGDTIRFTTEPAETRPLASRPGWGLVTSRNAGWNEAGDKVFAFTGMALWQMRAG